MLDKDGKEYEINFIFSKPDGTDTKIILKDQNMSKDINIGIYDQFQIMYLDAINNDLSKFKYSSYKNLIKRYEIYKKISDEIKF